MYNFYVGQKVVCVDATTHSLRTLSGLTQNRIYTVRAIERAPTDLCAWYLNCGIEVWLEEIVRSKRPEHNYREVGYSAARFRPLVQTDISVFQAMLNPTPQREDA